MLKITKTNKDSSSQKQNRLCAPAPRPACTVTALCYLKVTVIMELECSLEPTDRAGSRGMVSMAMASASEWLPVTTSWWFNEFITKFQKKTQMHQLLFIHSGELLRDAGQNGYSARVLQVVYPGEGVHTVSLPSHGPGRLWWQLFWECERITCVSIIACPHSSLMKWMVTGI